MFAVHVLHNTGFQADPFFPNFPYFLTAALIFLIKDMNFHLFSCAVVVVQIGVNVNIFKFKIEVITTREKNLWFTLKE
jgi:uncharacterized membrane protein